MDNLIRKANYIDGQWCQSESGKTFPVTNPADDSVIAQVPDCGVRDAENAIKSAHAAFYIWRDVDALTRATLLRRWFDLIVEHCEVLAELMTRECGKPLSESKGEVMYGASFVEWFAEEAKRIYGDLIPGAANDRRLIVSKEPVGVCAAITPWNFPLAMITRKCAPAIAAGCTVVVKPAEATPLTALVLAELADRAGIPKGVFNVLTCASGSEVGEVLSTHPLVRKLSFTGSTAVGKTLLKQSADTVKRVSMELGGNAPFIVFGDADLDAAVSGAIASKFRNAGQTCVCANRFIVHESVYEGFSSKLALAMGELKVGNGLEEGVAIGPLINQCALTKVERLVASAIESGAETVLGGVRHQAGSNFYAPTLLTKLDVDSPILHEEIFGPVVPIVEFSSDKQAIQVANDTPYGLAAYFYTEDRTRIWQAARALDFGMIGINEGIISSALAPFGGQKQSGLGREGSAYGLDEYLELKYLCMGGMRSPDLDGK